MVAPAAGGPTFPVAAAQTLADKLDQIVKDLDDAATARVNAAESMPEYKGRYAEDYRDNVAAYASKTSDTTDLFRRTAGRLRDAIDEHANNRQQWFDQGQPI
jgi:hypothetical protein